MWISRRDVGWIVATMAMAFAVVAVALATPWPVPVFAVIMACWIAMLTVRLNRRHGTRDRDKEGLE